MKQILTILLFWALLCQFGCTNIAIDPELIRRAEQGDKVAQNDLGAVYAKTYYGWPFYNNRYDKAFKWYRLAAEQGYAAAQFNLGNMYEKGWWVSRSDVDASKWYRLAAEQGYAAAQNSLGDMYQFGGIGVPQDHSEAEKWYHKADEQGYAAAQYNLGNMYLQGWGVSPNTAEALKWYRLAAGQGNENAKKGINNINEFEEKIATARQGDPSAQDRVGIMYDRGIGVALNKGEALKWFRMAAEQGYAQAQSDLAIKYWLGYGVTTDEVEALAWFYVANSNPERNTVTNLSQNITNLERKVGRNGRQAAQQRAKQLSANLQSKG